MKYTKLYKHQAEALEKSNDLNHVAFFHDMGLGKTFTGAEKLMRLGAKVNLIVCQKSKIDDWHDHMFQNYNITICDLTSKHDLDVFMERAYAGMLTVGIINYDLVWRRQELLKLIDFTLLLDESSLIQNETSKRAKFILKMHPANVVLLSGTPTGGKYERLWSQMHLLGWNISKETFWRQYITVEYLDTLGRSVPIVTGYKNVDRLKRKMAQYGCQFLKTNDVFDLPEQTFTQVRIPASKEYRIFRKNKIVQFDDVELIGDTTLTKMLYERQLCGIYSKEKLKAFTDLVESTEDRLIVFYNFTAELNGLMNVVMKLERKVSIISGKGKHLMNYEDVLNSITFVQYQAGAMGVNLQKANKIIYYTLPLSSELYEQSKKRIHRIGQNQPCFYYQLICKNSIEEKILKTLDMRQDYTEKLFEKDDQN